MKQSIVSAVALLCAGCALGAPAGVRVKTAPAIRVPSGNATTKLDDYLSADILKNLLGDYLDAEYYKYVPEDDKNTLHLLIRYPLINTEKLSEYLETIDLIKDELPGNEIEFDSPKDLILPSTDINLAEFKKALPDNLGFKSVAVKLYAGPGVAQYKLHGKIFMDYQQKAGGSAQKHFILGTEKDGNVSPDFMTFAGTLPELTGNSNHVLSPDDTGRYTRYPSSLRDTELQEVFNPVPERLSFYFEVVPQIGEKEDKINFKVGEITEDLLQFSVDMTLDISLAFVAMGDSEHPPIMRLDAIPGIDADSEQDIFGRKSAEENGELFDGVQAATLRLSYDNSLTSSDSDLSDLTANIQVRPENVDPKDARALTVRPFTVKHGTNQTVEVALDAGYVRNNLLYPKDIELAFIPKDDPARTLFSFAPGKDGTGGSFTLRGVEVETSLDHTFHF